MKLTNYQHVLSAWFDESGTIPPILFIFVCMAV